MRLSSAQQVTIDSIIQASPNPMHLIQYPLRNVTPADFETIKTYTSGVPSAAAEYAAVSLHRHFRTIYKEEAQRLEAHQLYASTGAQTLWQREIYQQEISHRVERNLLNAPTPILDGEELYPRPSAALVSSMVQRLKGLSEA